MKQQANSCAIHMYKKHRAVVAPKNELCAACRSGILDKMLAWRSNVPHSRHRSKGKPCQQGWMPCQS